MNMTTEKQSLVLPENVLYNGIELPDTWPPRDVSLVYNEVIDVPYLKEISEGGNHPEVVYINVGRQLFVDDFLIESTDLTPNYHTATPYEGNPVLSPETDSPWGKNCKHGGLYYDNDKRVLKLWLNIDASLYYFESRDGLQWSEGVKCVDAPGYATVVRNPNPANEWQTYVMLLRKSNGTYDPDNSEISAHNTYPFEIYISRDGINWNFVCEGGSCNDATTLFYNPFREKWVVSIRKTYPTLDRVREYYECDNILTQAGLSDLLGVFWMRADGMDIQDPVIREDPQIYSISCVAYESIMLGGIQLLLGPASNTQNKKTGIPKVTDIHLAYSRDGFYYSRPSRDPILEASQEAGQWDRGYLHQVNSLCVINGDELWFYYFGYEGDPSRAGTGVANDGTLDWGRLGLATMRRDGFVSMDGSGELLTRKMACTDGQKYLFVNAKASSLKAEILDENGNVIPGYGMDDCIAFSGDSTCTMLQWKNGKEISDLSGSVFQIRFSMENGELYSFWVSETEDGNSNGYYAGGIVG